MEKIHELENKRRKRKNLEKERREALLKDKKCADVVGSRAGIARVPSNRGSETAPAAILALRQW